MREFIFMQRNGIHIIDLNKTQALLQESLDEIAKVARSGKNVLFVGTKKQAQEIIRNEAQRCDMPYVTHRWLGGMLTNFVTIKKSISRMEEINAMQTDGTYENITKKERLMLDREKEKLENVMGGISKMGRLPGALFVVDIVKENIAVNEALKLNIPIFALVDTNCDPDVPDYIIPCNDDAAKAIQLVASNVADAIIEGMAEREAHQEEQLAAGSMDQEGSDQPEEMTEADVKPTRRKRSRKAKKSTEAVGAKGQESGGKKEEAAGTSKEAEKEAKASEKDAKAAVKDSGAEEKKTKASEKDSKESEKEEKKTAKKPKADKKEAAEAESKASKSAGSSDSSEKKENKGKENEASGSSAETSSKEEEK